MRPLKQALEDHDLIVLRVIGEWWELDLTGEDKPACIRALAETLPALDMPRELSYLPPEEAAALQALIDQRGRLPVAAYTRQHGEVRLMGPAALVREEPWFDPISAAEALWYRGFLYRGFDETNDGLVEFFYLPHELLAPFASPETAPVAPRPAPAATPPAAPAPAAYTAAVTEAVDDLTTLLTMAQMDRLREGQGGQLQPYLCDPDLTRLGLLTRLAVEMGLLRRSGEAYKPARAAVEWLQATRETQLRALAEAWSQSGWNELRHVPTLICEGSGWSNDPLAARTALLDALTLTADWYAIDSVLDYVKKMDPDFQRPNGNYDTWYIREAETGDYITGFEQWAQVEGRLLTYLLEAPMRWLGLAEVGEGRYRLTARALAWLEDSAMTDDDVAVPLAVRGDATLHVSRDTDRYQRFQVGRIADLLPLTETAEPFVYRLTPRSLQAAQAQGIAPARVLEFLHKASGGRPLPTSTQRAIERWAENGAEARLERVVVLRVAEAQILHTLRQHPKTRPLLGENIGDLAAVVQADQWAELRTQAATLGLLLAGDSEEE